MGDVRRVDRIARPQSLKAGRTVPPFPLILTPYTICIVAKNQRKQIAIVQAAYQRFQQLWY